MSFFSNFSFKNLGHYVAVAARDIVKAGPQIATDVQLVGGLAAFVKPSSAPAIAEIERASSAALGYVTDAAQNVVALADGTNTLTIQGLTSAEIADFQKLGDYFKNHAYANGVTLPGVSGASGSAGISSVQNKA